MALDEDGGVTLWELQRTKKASVTPKVTPNLNRTKLMIFKCNFTAGQSLKCSKPGLEPSAGVRAALCLLSSSRPG